MSEKNTAPAVKEAPAAKAQGYRFKKGATTLVHPSLGTLTLDHLKDPRIIRAIKRMDEKKETNRYFETNIEAA